MKKSTVTAIFTLSVFLGAGLSAAVTAGPCDPPHKKSCYIINRTPSVCAPYLTQYGEAPIIVRCGEAPYMKSCGEAPYIVVECVHPQICAPPSKSFHK